VKRFFLTNIPLFDKYSSMKRKAMKNRITVTIGSQIKELLDKKKLTAYRMCVDLGLDQSYLSKVLRNQVNPSYEFTKQMLNYLGYEIRFIKSKKKGGGSFR
jgi:transcriptional regulator with XRE-family HTH domain